MFNFLPRKRRWPIALDIGTDSIKMLQMKTVGGAVSVVASARWRFPESARQDPQERRKLTVSAVRQMLRKSSFRGRAVISVLPSSQLCIKNVRLPHMPDDELDEAIRWEARERLSFDIEAGCLNYLKAGQIRTDSEVRDEIIMLAASGETVEEHIALLGEMDLRPEHIEAEPLALFGAFQRFLRRRADEQAVTVVVEIGQSSTRVIVARGRGIALVKNIDVGGRKLNEAVAKRLNLTCEEAGELRIELMQRTDRQSEEAQPDASEGSEDWTIRDAERTEIETLARELSLCLRYCSVTFRGLRPNRVTLTGGEAYDPAMIKLLSDYLKIECVVGQPLKGIDVSTVDLGADRRGVLAEWAVCTGLALRNINSRSSLREADHEEHRLSA